jgi:lipopolysaccharide transport protein LptA
MQTFMVTDVQRTAPVPLTRVAAIDFKIDRRSAFRRARQHTFLVRALRIALPVVIVLLFASYGLFAKRSYEIGAGDGKLTIGPVSLSSKSITAENPQFEGYNKDGDKFVVKAKSAEHDLMRVGPIGLKLIEGTLLEQQSTVTKLRAPRGTFEPKTEVLELEERIEVNSSTGLNALLKHATAFMKEGRIVSAEPVTVQLPTGAIRGNELVLFTKSRQAVFSNGVSARLKQEARTEGADAATSPPAGLGKSNEPIDVVSAKLNVDDAKKLAVFSGNVRAVQGKAMLTADELEVSYEGRSGAENAGMASTSSSRLKRITAKANVVISQGEDRATSDSAEFDPVADTALLTGNVVITQANNVLKGRRLFLDRKSAISQLTSPADGGEPKGRINARLYQKGSGTGTALQNKGASDVQRGWQGGTQAMPMRADPDVPTDIEADQLDVDDKAKAAVFRGNVLVTQGDYTMRAAELTATYIGDSGIGLGWQTAEGSAKQAVKLEHIRARNTVFITSKDGQTGRGESAEFDVKTNIVTLVGNVVLTEGGNTATGPRAVMDLNTGKSQIVPDTADSTGSDEAGRSAAPRASASGGRPSLLIYPGQTKDKEKAKRKEGEGEPKRDGKDTTEPTAKGAGSAATRTSGWIAE